MDHAWSSSGSAEISCVQPKSHISFGFLLISFKLGKWLAMAEIWPPYSFGSPGVKIILRGVKNIKNFDYCLCSSLCSSFRAQFLSDLFLYLVHELVGMKSRIQT